MSTSLCEPGIKSNILQNDHFGIFDNVIKKENTIIYLNANTTNDISKNTKIFENSTGNPNDYTFKIKE